MNYFLKLLGFLVVNMRPRRPITAKPARFLQATLLLVEKNNGQTSDPAAITGEEFNRNPSRLEIEPAHYTA